MARPVLQTNFKSGRRKASKRKFLRTLPVLTVVPVIGTNPQGDCAGQQAYRGGIGAGTAIDADGLSRHQAPLDDGGNQRRDGRACVPLSSNWRLGGVPSNLSEWTAARPPPPRDTLEVYTKRIDSESFFDRAKWIDADRPPEIPTALTNGILMISLRWPARLVLRPSYWPGGDACVPGSGDWGEAKMRARRADSSAQGWVDAAGDEGPGSGRGTQGGHGQQSPRPALRRTGSPAGDQHRRTPSVSGRHDLAKVFPAANRPATARGARGLGPARTPQRQRPDRVPPPRSGCTAAGRIAIGAGGGRSADPIC